MAGFHVERITGFRFASPDPEAAAAFLRDALQARVEGDDALRLSLGGTPLTVRTGPVRAPAAANDPAFQHLAVVVSDIAEAHRRVLEHGGVAISRDGPVRLPPASGGVTAWKFRTPDGQPLELLETPTAAWRRRARDTGRSVLGIDHTALGWPDPTGALAALHGLGFRDGPPSHNTGPEQDRLDGLKGVDLRIRTLFTPGAGPHIELLTYAEPTVRGVHTTPSVTTRLAGATVEGSTEVVIGGHAFDLSRRAQT